MQDNSNSQHKVAVAMSGGVDSSVAALLLKDQGYDALGISMQVWDYRNNGGSCTRATCCSPDDFTDARRVAGRIGVPYYVFDFEKVFEERVINNFVDKYKNGLTPNPCVDCNSKVKFFELRKRAYSIGCDSVATGHYAQITKDDLGYHLTRGADSKKDQSYFLYGLSQKDLSQTIFPVGHLTKDEVRELARKAGLNTAAKPESQDICFVSGTVDDFIKGKIGKGTKGHIVDTNQKVVGEHEGIHRFTVGQRRGLGIGGSEEPLFVLEIDPEKNLVVVGKKNDLERESFLVTELNWISPSFSSESFLSKDKIQEFECIAQLRHRHAGVRVRVKVLDNGVAEVSFLDEWSTVSPGQAAVFYDLKNEEVLGGGRISQQRRHSLNIVDTNSYQHPSGPSR